MKLALIILVAVLALAGYHWRVVSGLEAQLQKEIGGHAAAQGELAACKSATRATCAVERAVEGKADAREMLSNLIKERKK